MGPGLRRGDEFMVRTMFDEYRLIALQRTSMHNRKALTLAKVCGCYYCGGDFAADQITECVDDNDTALCPRCGIDAVLGFDADAADKELLLEMHKRWFGNSRPKNWYGPPVRTET
jgi:hypothetical protein